MYKFKLKEIEVGDTDTKGGKKSTVTDVNPETGAITWDIKDVADFTSTYKELEKAKDFLSKLEKTGKSKDDPAIDKLAAEIQELFNTFRTHIRKNYPEEYERVSRLKENALQGPETKDVYEVGDTVIYRKGNVAHSGTVELRTKDFDYYVTDDSDGKGYLVKMDDVIGLNLEEGEGIGYLTPRAFAKNKKSKGAPSIYYYKLGYKPVPKKIKGSGLEVKQLFEKEKLTEYSDFQQKRINVFDEIEEKINSISPLLSSAKNKTAEYYNENPGSYTIVYSTDMANELLDDIIELLKQSE